MNNNVNLTDNELTVIMTALDLVVLSTKQHMSNRPEVVLDSATMEVFNLAQQLHARLEKDYF